MPRYHKAAQSGTSQSHRHTKEPRDVIAVDFSGPYPDGHYNLVAIDKRTRYPEVVKTHLAAFQPTTEKLKTMFATHGTPRQLESDNGPPINSREFAEFAKSEGFHHHRVTLEHARVIGEVESFIKLLFVVKESGGVTLVSYTA